MGQSMWDSTKNEPTKLSEGASSNEAVRSASLKAPLMVIKIGLFSHQETLERLSRRGSLTFEVMTETMQMEAIR